MTQGVDAVASAFHRVMAAGGTTVLVDNAGEAAYVEVPLDGALQAQLAFNPAQGAWVLSIVKPLDHLAANELEATFETLVMLTNRVRFSTGLVASLDDEGRISLSSVLPVTPSPQDVAIILNRSMELLSSRPVEMTEILRREEEVLGEGWIRV